MAKICYLQNQKVIYFTKSDDMHYWRYAEEILVSVLLNDLDKLRCDIHEPLIISSIERRKYELDRGGEHTIEKVAICDRDAEDNLRGCWRKYLL